MFFWKKEKEIILQCSICEWNPDGKNHWACSCGHVWNTFDTKGKCPRCKTQWEETWCPGCKKSTPHKNWYKTKKQIEEIEKSGNTFLGKKKKSLETRLIDLGIRNYRISHLPYLDPSNEKFHSEYETGTRVVILNAISYLVHNLDERLSVINWFKNEEIWNKVSPNEIEFLTMQNPPQNLLIELSWRIESALCLGWCLKKVKTLPKLDEKNYESVFEELDNNIPEIGQPLKDFLSNLEYRSFDEIYEENLLNEIATSYFRDLMFSNEEDATKINRLVNFERHQSLNWLRTSYALESKEIDGELWDEVDMST